MTPPDASNGPDDESTGKGGTSSNDGNDEESARQKIINISQNPVVVDAGSVPLHLRHMSLSDMAHYESWLPGEDRTAREMAVHILERQMDEEATSPSVALGSLSDDELRHAFVTWISETTREDTEEAETLDEAANAFESWVEGERQKMAEHAKAIVSSAADVRTTLPMQSALDDLREVITGADWMVRSTGFPEELRQWERLQAQIKEVSEVARRIHEASTLPLASLGKELEQYGNIVEGLQLPDLAPRLTQQLISPVEYYSEFARTTIFQIESETTVLRREALIDSLALADAQLADSLDMVERLLQSPLADIEAFDPGHYNLFQRQQTELLEAEPSRAPEATRLEDLHRLSGSAQVGRCSRQLFEQCVRCNENARMAGDDDVFKPTNQLVAHAVAVPFQVSRDSESLGDLVDALYVTLYEAAGSDSLRYLERGYVKDEECGVVWRVKSFRNHWFRHDPDHGDSSSQSSKYRKLKEALQKYGLKEKPHHPDACEQLHRQLVEDACDFVQLIAERIKQP